jgi:hypothetical protein
MSSQWWEISGTLHVEESATARVLRRRPLIGVSIDIAGWPDERGCFSVWGHAHTDREGRFRLRVNRPSWAHRLRITASFVGELLVVCDSTTRGLAGRSPITIWEPDDPIEGPFVDAGNITIREGAAGELGASSAVRRAVSWYAAKSAMDYLSSLGEGLGVRRRIAVACPAEPSGIPLVRDSAIAGPLTLLASHDDEWSVDMVVRQVMRHWARQTIAGRINWPRNRLTTPVDEQFADLAKDELMRALWGRRSGVQRRVSGGDSVA